MDEVLRIVRDSKLPQLVNDGIVDALEMRYVVLDIGAKNPSVQHGNEC